MISSLNFKTIFWSNLTDFEPFDGLLDSIVGKTVSITTATLLVLVVAVTAVPALPAVSLKAILKLTVPAESLAFAV